MMEVPAIFHNVCDLKIWGPISMPQRNVLRTMKKRSMPRYLTRGMYLNVWKKSIANIGEVR